MRARFRMAALDSQRRPAAGGQVSVKLGEVTSALADAYRADRTWLVDFADDEVQLSQDLYEVLSAYMRLRPTA